MKKAEKCLVILLVIVMLPVVSVTQSACTDDEEDEEDLPSTGETEPDSSDMTGDTGELGAGDAGTMGAGDTGTTDYGVAIPVRDFLFRSEPESDGYGAYGYFIFNQRPLEWEKQRYRRAWEAFMNCLPPVSENLYYNRSDLMVTYWMLDDDTEMTYDRRGQETVVRSEDAIEHYDYSRACMISSACRKLSASGPFLVAFTHPFREVLTGRAADGSRLPVKDALVFDMSRFTDSEFDRALGIWMEQICMDPECWRNGFSMVRFRESLRQFILKYGNDVLAFLRFRDPESPKAEEVRYP